MFDYFSYHDIKIIIHHLFFTFSVAKQPSPNVFQCFSLLLISDITSEIQPSDVTFNAACELSQPMGKTQFSSTAKIRTNSVF